MKNKGLIMFLSGVAAALAVGGVGPSLADGGEPVKDFPMSYPSANWDSVWGEMFLEP